MNIKKHLQKQAENDAQALLTDDDKEYIKQLVKSEASLEREPEPKKNKRLWAVLGGLATVAVTSIIIFPSVFANKKVDDIFYQEANIKETACSLEDIQSNSRFFQLEENDTEFTMHLHYDSVSNDKLYFSVSGKTLIATYEFYLVVNNNYNFEFILGQNLKTKNLSNYEISYKRANANEIEGLGVNYIACINVQTEIIYIEYKQLFDVGEQAFFDDIERIIKVK